MNTSTNNEETNIKETNVRITWAKLPKEVKKNMTDEEKKDYIRLRRNEFYRNYYSNNKEVYSGYKKKHYDKVCEKQKEHSKEMYNNNADVRIKKSIYFYKKKYPDDEKLQAIIKDDSIDNATKINNIKSYRTNLKFQ